MPRSRASDVREIAQRVGGVADLALARAEHQDVAVEVVDQFGDRPADAVGLVDGPVGIGRVDQRAVPDLDRVGAARHRDDRGVGEVGGEALGVDGGRRDDDLEVGALGEQPSQVAEQEVDVEAALVGLVDDDRVVAAERAVALDLGQQDAVGHELDHGVGPDLVGEAHRIADDAADLSCPLDLVGGGTGQ